MMDPDETLVEIRQAAEVMAGSEVETPEWVRAAEDLQERVQALDEWLSKGGFPPEEWRRG